MNIIDDGFGYWLAGFMDGEGSFGIGRRKGGASGRNYYCYASIKLRDDDRPILELIQQRTSLGQLYANKARGKSKPGYQWLVTSKPACRELVDIFDRFPLRAKKSRDYAIWREAVLLWFNQPLGHRWKGVLVDHPHWDSLWQALRQIREYGGRPVTL